MRYTFVGLATAAVIALASGAQAAPLGVAGGLGSAGEALDIAEPAQFFFGGARYCWYDGWRGPGWYQCGYGWRRGYGWGGPLGWQGWRRGGPGPYGGGGWYGGGRRYGPGPGGPGFAGPGRGPGGGGMGAGGPGPGVRAFSGGGGGGPGPRGGAPGGGPGGRSAEKGDFPEVGDPIRAVCGLTRGGASAPPRFRACGRLHKRNVATCVYACQSSPAVLLSHCNNQAAGEANGKR